MYVPIDFISLKLGLCPLEQDAMWPGKDLSAFRKNQLPHVSTLKAGQSMFLQKPVNFYPEGRAKHVPPKASKFLP